MSTFQTIRNNCRWLHTARINIYGLRFPFRLCSTNYGMHGARGWSTQLTDNCFLFSASVPSFFHFLPWIDQEWALIGFTFAGDNDLNNVNGQFHQYACVQLESTGVFNQQRVRTQTVNKNVNFHLNAVIFHFVDCRYISLHQIYRSYCLMEHSMLPNVADMIGKWWILMKLFTKWPTQVPPPISCASGSSEWWAIVVVLRLRLQPLSDRSNPIHCSHFVRNPFCALTKHSRQLLSINGKGWIMYHVSLATQCTH